MVHKRKSCPVYGHENLSVNCTCNERMHIERRMLYYPEFDIFRLATWSYQALQWDEHPGVLNNPIAAYSKLKNTNESFGRKGSSGDQAAEIIRNTPWKRPMVVNGIDDDKVRFGIDVAKDNSDAVAAIRNGEIIGHVVQGPNGSWDVISKDAIVFLREELDAKTNDTEPQGKEWQEYDPNAEWRRSPDPIRVEEICQFFGKQITEKWLNGYEKYGILFKGDPVEHAFLEARDHMAYLWYIREEREHLRQNHPFSRTADCTTPCDD